MSASTLHFHLHLPVPSGSLRKKNRHKAFTSKERLVMKKLLADFFMQKLQKKETFKRFSKNIFLILL